MQRENMQTQIEPATCCEATFLVHIVALSFDFTVIFLINFFQFSLYLFVILLTDKVENSIFNLNSANRRSISNQGEWDLAKGHLSNHLANIRKHLKLVASLWPDKHSRFLPLQHKLTATRGSA